MVKRGENRPFFGHVTCLGGGGLIRSLLIKIALLEIASVSHYQDQSETSFLGKSGSNKPQLHAVLRELTFSLFARRHPLIYHLVVFFLKAQVYKHRPTTLQALKEAIIQAVAAIPPEMTPRIMDNFRGRLHQCVTIGGRHLADIIFKTN
ncbi:uncharacterized protein TNCV_4199941 [Trichonephila clavipes]|uniref:Uncharacterized protein n=1 Tax=Trichonephila clavipes TaxID=2585209 RepID=A0A8X7BHT1_TRICX|nr:uncharacterized protein TNCV_4199941 [Trichonephila clavipes]